MVDKLLLLIFLFMKSPLEALIGAHLHYCRPKYTTLEIDFLYVHSTISHSTKSERPKLFRLSLFNHKSLQAEAELINVLAAISDL